MKNLIIILIALMTTNESCSNKNIAKSESKTSAVKENNEIDSNKWFLVKMEAEKVNSKNAFIEVDTKELKFSGKSFCNNIFGRLVTDKQSKIEFTNLGMTMMACEDMSQEQKMNSLLRTVKSFKLVNDVLVLSDENEKEILSFSAVEPKTSEAEKTGEYHNEKSPLNRLYDIWGLKMMNGKEISNKKGMMLEMNTKEMTFNGFASCNKIFGSIAGGKENELNFVNVGATRKFCPEVMETENELIASLKKVKSYQLKNLHLLMFDENNELLLDFIKMD